MPRKSKAPEAKTVLAKLPAGFKLKSDGDMWRGHDLGDTLVGKYLGFKVMKLKKKGNRAARDINLHEIVDTHGEIHKVMQSAGLRSLEGLKKNQQVFIQYLGERVINKGDNPMREYRVAAK
jgi:hypothetical protein